jgi:hypothetical protein
MTRRLRQTYLLPDDGGAFLERVLGHLPELFSVGATLDPFGLWLAMVPHSDAVKVRLAWGAFDVRLAVDAADGWTGFWVDHDCRSDCDQALLAVFSPQPIWLEPVSCTFANSARRAEFDVAYSVEIALIVAMVS